MLPKAYRDIGRNLTIIANEAHYYGTAEEMNNMEEVFINILKSCYETARKGGFRLKFNTNLFNNFNKQYFDKLCKEADIKYRYTGTETLDLKTLVKGKEVEFYW